MSNKVAWMGWITLLGFPLLGYLITYGFDHTKVWEFLSLESFTLIPIGYGLMFGYVYGFLSILLTQAPYFNELNGRMERFLGSLKLTFIQGLFLSLCAGFGEELFFRGALQPYLGVWITSILFVAIHGYLNPMNWRKSLYGLIVLPFIVLLSLGFEFFGLGFAISVHTSYDAVLFTYLIQSPRENP